MRLGYIVALLAAGLPVAATDATRAARAWREAHEQRRTADLVIGTLSPGDSPELTLPRLLDTRSSFGSEQPTHLHPFFSPDARMAFLNSDESGRPRACMVTGYQFPPAK